MNKAQAKRIERLTSLITRETKLPSGEGWMNGPVVFRAESAPDDSVMFSATNCTPERRWYETSCFALVFIGPRGGLRVSHREGFYRHIFK